MDTVQIALIAAGSALGGSFIGAAASLVTMFVQTSRDDASQRREAAVQLALAEHAMHVALAKENRGDSVPPIATYISYHLSILNKAAKGSLSADDIIETTAETRVLTTALRAALSKK